MPLREYECPVHGKFEKIIGYRLDEPWEKCPKCGEKSKQVDWSVPARRDPRQGIQR